MGFSIVVNHNFLIRKGQKCLLASVLCIAHLWNSPPLHRDHVTANGVSGGRAGKAITYQGLVKEFDLLLVRSRLGLSRESLDHERFLAVWGDTSSPLVTKEQYAYTMVQIYPCQ